jgi:integrase
MREKPPGSRRWELRAYIGRDPQSGKPKQVSRVVHGGRREAQRELAKLVVGVGEGKVRSRTTKTVGFLCDQWMATIVERHRSPNTVASYRGHIEKHIKPGLGDLQIDRVDAHTLDKYLTDLEDSGLARNTVKLDHAVLSGAFSQAVRWGWVIANPVHNATLGPTHRVERPTLTVDELRAIYMAALAADEDMGAAVALAAITGCRRGELCGLQWRDWDRARRSLRVERQLVPDRRGGLEERPPKTGRGRTVFIGDKGTMFLDGYLRAKRDLLGHGPDPTGWLLSPDGGTTSLRPNALTTFMWRLSKRIGVPFRFHDLRHFAASTLMAGGTDLATAAGQLGHSPTVMAHTYIHTSDELGSRAGELIAGVVAKALAPGQP